MEDLAPVRLGIIGCGIAARKLHWPALQRLSDKFEIAVVCNHTEPKAREFAEMVGGVDYVLDYRELLARPEVEAVDIALPIYLNYPVVRDALEAGKHVIVEKPLAANLEEADKMLELAGRYPELVTMVAENYHYRPTFHRASELIEQGAIGTPYSAIWNVFYYVSPDTNPYARTAWRQHPKHKGAFVSDGGVHNIHALRLLFGEFVSGYAQAQSINPEIGRPDTFRFLFETESGVQGSFNVYFSASGWEENRLLIFGSSGSLAIEQNRVRLRAQGRPWEEFHVEDDGGYMGEFLDFYQAIRLKDPGAVPFEEAYRDLAIILGALDSAEKQEVVHFAV